MARCIDLDDAIRIAIEECVKVVGHGISQVEAVDIAIALEDAPTADVVPKKEITNVLRDLKIAVHNNTFHPNSMGISSYITIKTFDAVLQNFITKYEQKKGGA